MWYNEEDVTNKTISWTARIQNNAALREGGLTVRMWVLGSKYADETEIMNNRDAVMEKVADDALDQDWWEGDQQLRGPMARLGSPLLRQGSVLGKTEWLINMVGVCEKTVLHGLTKFFAKTALNDQKRQTKNSSVTSQNK